MALSNAQMFRLSCGRSRHRPEFSTNIQGKIVQNDSNEEQGGILDNCSDDMDIDMIDVIPNNLARYPSNEEFDSENALKSTFGLTKFQTSFSLNKSINSESDQLGVMMDNTVQNEMERLSFEQEEGQKFCSQTDKQMDDQIVGNVVPVTNDFCKLKILLKSKPKSDINFNNDDLEMGLPSFNKQEAKEEISNSGDDEESKHRSGNTNTDQKETRWSKEDDKRLYATYRSLCIKEMYNLKEVITTPLKKNKKYNQLIEKVGKTVGWTGKKSKLVGRLRKIFNNIDLSVREKQALTRMYKQQVKNGEVDWNQILYEFPGKTMIFIKDFCSRMKISSKVTAQQADNSSESEERKDGDMDCGNGSDDDQQCLLANFRNPQATKTKALAK